MTIRQAEREEIGQLVELRLQFLAEVAGEPPGGQAGDLAAVLERYLDRHLGRDVFALAAEEDGRLVSAALLTVVERPAGARYPTGWVGVVLNVYTCPSHRRRGLAERVMAAALACAEDLGLDCVELQATAAGQPLYRKLGFRETVSADTPMAYDFRRAKAPGGPERRDESRDPAR